MDNEMIDQRFRGKTIVITGAGGQLGRAGCLYFSQRGCRVAAMDISPTLLDETVRECEANGYSPTAAADDDDNTKRIVAFVCDVTDATAVAAVFTNIVATFGDIHYLWNNAGYQGQIAPILDQDPADFEQVLRINVTGMFIVLQAAARCMVRQRQQSTATTPPTASSSSASYFAIVNTASVAALRGTPAMSGYASSKAAVITLTITAAKELATHGIRVNAISPALIGPGTLWERQNRLHSQVGPPYFASDADAVGEAKIQSVPLKRLGSPVEVVQSVAYLLSDDASYTTGINLVVDGGMAAGLKA
jgi:NAD(P)-dependent dehydrogenase (short-subunit alcohol dehydrogenase family)